MKTALYTLAVILFACIPFLLAECESEFKECPETVQVPITQLRSFTYCPETGKVLYGEAWVDTTMFHHRRIEMYKHNWE
jgi:hypothetical protein